mmetsp:Transcript_33843/g.55647  ORF Transcript_33843/g.55647 Transcript_33843/m.55647 type:complete len:83 (+) Transcript_33843:436-684(+)
MSRLHNLRGTVCRAVLFPSKCAGTIVKLTVGMGLLLLMWECAPWVEDLRAVGVPCNRSILGKERLVGFHDAVGGHCVVQKGI